MTRIFTSLFVLKDIVLDAVVVCSHNATKKSLLIEQLQRKITIKQTPFKYLAVKSYETLFPCFLMIPHSPWHQYSWNNTSFSYSRQLSLTNYLGGLQGESTFVKAYKLLMANTLTNSFLATRIWKQMMNLGCIFIHTTAENQNVTQISIIWLVYWPFKTRPYSWRRHKLSNVCMKIYWLMAIHTASCWSSNYFDIYCC